MKTNSIQDGRLLLDNSEHLCVQSRKLGFEKFQEGEYVQHSPCTPNSAHYVQPMRTEVQIVPTKAHAQVQIVLYVAVSQGNGTLFISKLDH